MRCVAGVLIFIIPGYLLQAQSYFYKENIVEPDWLLELGIGTGILNCQTDLGGKNNGLFAADWNCSRPAGSLLALGTFRHLFGFRIQMVHGSLTAADSIIGAGEAGSRYDRNLHFRSKLTDLSALLEFYPFALMNSKISTAGIQPFLMGGMGWFWFNPTAIIDGKLVELQPLHTEGQGFTAGKERQHSYRLNDMNMAMGLGFRWETGPFMHVRLEMLHRILFTDYLDDVSTRYSDIRLFEHFLPAELSSLAMKASDRRRTGAGGAGDIRGNPSKKDAYFQIQIAATVLLNRKQAL